MNWFLIIGKTLCISVINVLECCRNLFYEFNWKFLFVLMLRKQISSEYSHRLLLDKSQSDFIHSFLQFFAL